MNQSTSIAVRGPYAQPSFVAVVVVLLVAAIGLNTAVAKLQLHFKKLPVPLALPLTNLPLQMGNWIQVSRDEPLDPDVQEVLGTDKYVFRDYLDFNAHRGQAAVIFIQGLHSGEDQDKLDAMKSDYQNLDDAGRLAMVLHEVENKDKTNEQRKRALALVQEQYPDAAVNMAVTYYTGLVDTVAHIPDRCYIADGFEPTDYDFPTWQRSDGGAPLPVRFINFQDQSGAGRINRSVAYFFQVNGRYTSDSLEVRRSLANLFEKYGYYAKVELMTLDPDHDRSARTMTNFLGSSLAQVEKLLPDWQKIAGH
jgi:Protein of unknown function (DUF3485)